MKQTTNYNLVKPELTDSPPDITVMNPNWDKIDAKLRANEEQIENLGAYGVASGINTYTAAITGITTLTEGFTVRIKFTNANTGASTLNINSLGAKSILKGNGSTLSSGNIKAGQICNLAYTGSNFQLLGEGGEYGTATASDVLSGETIGTEEGLVTGTMPNRGAVNQNLTTEGQEYTIPSGYHNGVGKIKAVITGLIASVIKAGTTVGGILGTFTSDATAEEGEVLSGRTYYKNGTKVTGSMPVQGQKIQYLSQQNEKFIIARGYHTGDGFVQASFANLSAGNIKDGVNVGGVVGTLKPAILTGDIPTIAASDANIAYLLRNYSERKWTWSNYETLVKLKVKFTGSFRASMKASRDSSYSGRDVTVNHVVNGVSVATTTKSVSSGSSWTAVGDTVSIPVNEGDIYEFQAKIPNGFCDFYEFKAWGYPTEPIEILS